MDTGPEELTDLSFEQLLELDRRAAERAGDSDGSDRGSGGGADHGDDPIVLPWWQHPVNIATMLITAVILAGTVGWMVGDSGARSGHNEVDTGFLQDMREHHEQAVLMGFIFRGLPDTSPGLRTVAGSIVRGQSIEVGRMIQLLRDFGEPEANEGATSMTWMGMSRAVGQMPGMATDEELQELGRSSGRSADELFVALMTAHHVGGIAMAEFAAENAGATEVRSMAAAMASAQSGEIIEMENELR